MCVCFEFFLFLNKMDKNPKKIWAQEKNSFAEIDFFRSSSVDNFNHGMKEVDVADHKMGSLSTR